MDSWQFERLATMKRLSLARDYLKRQLAPESPGRSEPAEPQAISPTGARCPSSLLVGSSQTCTARERPSRACSPPRSCACARSAEHVLTCALPAVSSILQRSRRSSFSQVLTVSDKDTLNATNEVAEAFADLLLP